MGLYSDNTALLFLSHFYETSFVSPYLTFTSSMPIQFFSWLQNYIYQSFWRL